MENVKCNFRGQHNILLCDICKREEEATEHGLLFTQVERNPVQPVGLKDPDDQGNWTKICSKMRIFMKPKKKIFVDQDYRLSDFKVK